MLHDLNTCMHAVDMSCRDRNIIRKRGKEDLQQQQQQQQQPSLLQELLQQWQAAAGAAAATQPEQQQQQPQLWPLYQQQLQLGSGSSSSSTVVLYHQTSPEIARAILSTGQMKPGSKGYGGAGIYFAAAPEITTAKATKKGVILECEVDLGKVKDINCSGDWSGRLWHWLYDYDSIKITSISDGVEWVVFDSSRVRAVRLWRPGVGVDKLALLLVLAGNAASVLQCALLAVAQVLQVLQQMLGATVLDRVDEACGNHAAAESLPSCGRPSLRSLGKC
jgi:hypothetical protein